MVRFAFIVVVVIVVGGILGELVLIMSKNKSQRKSYGESLLNGNSCSILQAMGQGVAPLLEQLNHHYLTLDGSFATKSAYLDLVHVVT